MSPGSIPHIVLSEPPALAKVFWLEIPSSKKIRSAKGEFSVGTKVILKLSSSTATGWSEVGALSTFDFGAGTLEQAWEALPKALPALSKFGGISLIDIDKQLGELPASSSTCAALSVALWDFALRAISERPSVFECTRPLVKITDFKTLADASSRVSPFPRFKVSSLDEIKSVLDQSRTGCELLIIDCNQAFLLSQLSALNELLSEQHVIVEEPCKVGSLPEYQKLANEIQFDWALDESLTTAVRLREIHSATRSALRPPVFCLKLALMGTVSALLDVVQGLAAIDAPFRLGGMFETGIGRAFNLALASHLALALPSDASPPSAYLESDLLTSPIALAQPGYATVPKLVGLSPAVDESLVARYTVREFSINL